jgi:putative adhesin
MQRPTITTTTLAAALCACVASPLLFAATPIEQTRPLDAHGSVEVDNLKGRIRIRAWDRNEVRISGSLGEGVEKLVVDGGGDHLVVRVQYPRQIGAWRGDHTGPTNLQLQVPLRADLDIQSVSADIDVDGVAPGDLSVDTVSGKIVVAAAPEHAEINSVSGDVLATLNSNDVKVETVSGDAIVSGRLKGQVHGETVAGRLSIDSNSERVRRLTTGTVSGNTRIRVALADGGEIKSETVSGDIALHLPKSLSARVSGESFSGDLRAPGAKIRKEEFGPGASFEQRYGNGAGEIRLETFSGDVDMTLE